MRPFLFALVLSMAMAMPAHAASTGLARAEQSLRSGQIDAALGTLREWVAANPGDVAAHELIIDILGTTGRGELALVTYQSRVEAPTPSPDDWYLAGRAQPDLDASETAFQEALKLQADHPRAWMGLGAVFRVRGEADAAEHAYGKALAADPGLAEAWNGRVTLALERKDSAAARGLLHQAIKAVPGDSDAWLNLARLEPGNAPQLLERATRKITDDPRLYLSLGRAQFEAQAWPKAATAYEQVLRLSPADAGVRAEYALVMEIQSGALSGEAAAKVLQTRNLATQNPAAAMANLDDVVGRHPRSAWGRLVRGNLRLGQGDAVGAEADIRAALSRIPNSPEVWGALGRALIGQQKPADALPWLDRAAAARSEDVALAVTAGLARADAGDRAGAELRLREARATFRHDTAPTLALARLLLSNGDPDGAWAVLSDTMTRQINADLVVALAAAARDGGRPEEAALLLDTLARELGDARYQRAAAAIRSGNVPAP